MATFVLVHGGWCASWCWDFNVPALEKAGHKVLNLNLPGHGDNQSKPLEEVHLADHVKYVEEVLKGVEEKVILVAHSMTGMVISQVAEDMPEKIDRLVYFAAFLPEADGVKMDKYLAEDPWTLVSDKTVVYLPNGLCTFDMRYGRNMGFNTTPDELFFFSASHMQLECPNMWHEPVHITERFAAVPKFYIHTLKDNCCSYYIQRVMVQRQPVYKEYYIDADHTAMIDKAEETNAILLDIANQPIGAPEQ